MVRGGSGSFGSLDSISVLFVVCTLAMVHIGALFMSASSGHKLVE